MKWLKRRQHSTTEEEVLQVKRRHESELLRRPGVLGVGVGFKKGSYFIRLYVTQDWPGRKQDRLPDHLDGVRVEKQESHELRAG